ncbi:MAG TPA: thermonuclease family protein [Rhizomicrobium sp.]|nr:thermonuclease family protein [Rhizomicrobium sp.]
MLPRSVLTVIALLWLWPAMAAPPSCIPAVEIARAKVVRVERNGVLVLEDGRAARLEGILLPAGASDRAPDFFAGQAIAKLAELATAHTIVLAAEAPKEDRYGRLRAQALLAGGAGERWLQRALLEQGLARVSVAPDRGECAAELYAAEGHARAEKMGIWSLDAYRVRTPGQLGDAGGTFQIVEGTIEGVSDSSGRVFLEFGRDRRKDFAVVITSDDLKIFRSIGVDPFSYQNQTVRVRGWLDQSRHPEMEVATPADIEVIEGPTLRGSVAAPE